MKYITILLMKYHVWNAERKYRKLPMSVLGGAYLRMIQSYRDTIMFLEAERESE